MSSLLYKHENNGITFWTFLSGQRITSILGGNYSPREVETHLTSEEREGDGRMQVSTFNSLLL
jgi:hypothetical protein